MPIIEDHMADATILEKLSPEARAQLRSAAQELRSTEDELIALVVEHAFGPALPMSEEDLAETRKAVAEADAGGPFVAHDDMLQWLKALAEGQDAPAPEATIRLS
jgi:hypothetical protein